MADMNSKDHPQGHLNTRGPISHDQALIHARRIKAEHPSFAVATLTDPGDDAPNFPSGELASMAWEGWVHTEPPEEPH